MKKLILLTTVLFLPCWAHAGEGDATKSCETEKKCCCCESCESTKPEAKCCSAAESTGEAKPETPPAEK
jgi:hypothetical protein